MNQHYILWEILPNRINFSGRFGVFVFMQIHVLNQDEQITTTHIHQLHISTPWKVLVHEDNVKADRNPKIAI